MSSSRTLRALRLFPSRSLQRISRRCLSATAYAAPKIRSSILGEDNDEFDAEDAFDRGGAHFGSGPMDFDGVSGHSAAMDKVDLAMVRIGDAIDIPYEVTAGEFWRVRTAIHSISFVASVVPLYITVGFYIFDSK